MASQDEIQQAYLKLAKAYHPDLNATNTMRDGAAMATLNVAYSVLKKPALRKSYDERMTLLGKCCAVCKGAAATFKQKGFKGRIPVPCSKCDGTGILDHKV